MSNRLQGLLPVPPPSILYYTIPNNSVIGEIPPSICSSGSLQILDLSNYNLSGKGKQVENDQPQSEQVQVQLPRSLANNSKLESLDVSEKRLIDVFPSLLLKLSELKVLILRCNKFHGTITTLKYLNVSTSFRFPKFLLPQVYNYSMIMTNKGMEMVYERVQKEFIAIDISSNRFQGEIAECMGDLIGLHLLSFSHNFLNLVNLEAFNLSHKSQPALRGNSSATD
ncbi:LRR domain containing protein [Trema orientale]|uniref:LRR domain containing protein n=1 Tax=Trema orientale TaxID=63057 RepID=A0A2P5FEL0_TREOI|nr:LRR domain containing protein [Trema orientale]